MVSKRTQSITSSKVIGRVRINQNINSGTPNERIEQLVDQYLDEIINVSSYNLRACRMQIYQQTLNRLSEYTDGNQLTFIQATRDR
jgi:cobalamin biosynthesis Co2+ chelatase CbiK